MKLLTIIVLLCTISLSCKEKTAGVTDIVQADTTVANDTSPAQTDTIPEKPGTVEPDEDARLRAGDHMFTLHWISWDFPGKVNIQPDSSGWYSIRGGQKSRTNKDYITIDGLVKIVNETDLLFKGNIESRVETVSNGNVCKKDGEQIFRTRAGRKYWRLQNMNSCEGGTVDYIDIYFN